MAFECVDMLVVLTFMLINPIESLSLMQATNPLEFFNMLLGVTAMTIESCLFG